MLLATAAALSAVDGVGSSPPLLESIAFPAPFVLPGRPGAAQLLASLQHTELGCSLNARGGTLLVSCGDGAGAASSSMTASMRHAAPASIAAQLPSASCASDGGIQDQHSFRTLQRLMHRGKLRLRSAVAAVMGAGGDGRADSVSALPDEALHPTQLDAALHLAAVDVSTASSGLRVPATAAALLLHGPAAHQAGDQQQAAGGMSQCAAASVWDPAERLSMSTHRLDTISAGCTLSDMVAKPLTAGLPSAEPRLTALSEQAADMLYSVEWQAATAANSAPHFLTAAPAMTAHDSRLDVHMRPVLRSARAVAAGIHVAAVSAASSRHNASALTAAAEQRLSPAQQRSASAAILTGVLSGTIKTLAREASSVHTSIQLADTHYAASADVHGGTASRVQLGIRCAGQQQSSDEHGALLSCGAGLTPIMTRHRLRSASVAAPPSHLSQGKVIITGEPWLLLMLHSLTTQIWGTMHVRPVRCRWPRACIPWTAICSALCTKVRLRLSAVLQGAWVA